MIATRSAWAGSREIVHIVYDPDVISYETLLEKARQMKCTNAVYTFNEEQHKAAKDAGIENVIVWQDDLETRQVRKSEQKYYLRQSVYGCLPLTELQAVKMNAVVAGLGGRWKPDDFLSPRQKTLLRRLQKAYAAEPESLRDFGFPEDQRNLVAYQQELEKKLESLGQ